MAHKCPSGANEMIGLYITSRDLPGVIDRFRLGILNKKNFFLQHFMQEVKDLGEILKQKKKRFIKAVILYFST